MAASDWVQNMPTGYVVRVLDWAGRIVAYWDTQTVIALRYSRVVNGVGMCQITVPYSQARADVLYQDVFIEVLRDGEVEGTYLLRYRRDFLDEGEQAWIIASGFSLEYLLQQRLVNPEHDPLEAGGYSTKGGTASTVIWQLVNEQAGPGAPAVAQVPYLYLATDPGTGEQVGVRLAWENLLTTVQGLARQGDVDFTLTRVSGVQLEFAVTQVGADRTKRTNFPGGPFVLLQPEFGNLFAPDREQDARKQKTVAHLLLRNRGGGTRNVFTFTDGAMTDTPYAYAALAADARKAESTEEYLTQGRTLLRKNAAKESFSFAMRVEDYDARWALGDIVTVAWRGEEDDYRITGVEVDVSEAGEVISPTLERWT